MDPLVIVDLISGPEPVLGPAVVAAHHRYTDPERPLRTVDHAGDWERAFHDAAGIQVTGSTWMVDDVAWAGDLGAALEAAAGRGVPVLGVCFGHQLLGTHFGSRLGSWPEGRHALAPVQFQASGPFEAEEVEVLHTHRDHLTHLGSVLEAVATGGLGGVQAFRHRELPIWGIQGHPEADATLCGLDGAHPWREHYSAARLDTPAAKGVLGRFGALMAARERKST